MPSKFPMKNTKSKSKVPKNPFVIGQAGSVFQPSSFGEDRGSEKGWVDKLPFFGKMSGNPGNPGNPKPSMGNPKTKKNKKLPSY